MTIPNAKSETAKSTGSGELASIKHFGYPRLIDE
jgi:hypothetical protein